jgi:tellurium resistance protein TerD
MAVNLSKGGKVDLTKKKPGLKHLIIGLGWDINKYDGGGEFDLDAAAFMLDASGKAASEADFVFYNNPKHVSGSVVHSGDNRTGAGEGDDEVINVDLSLVPANIEKIDFTVTIFDGAERKQNFGMVSNSYIHIVDADDNEELVNFDLGEDFSGETAVVAGELYRHQGEWKFTAIGQGYDGGLAALCNSYGLAT